MVDFTIIYIYAFFQTLWQTFCLFQEKIIQIDTQCCTAVGGGSVVQTWAQTNTKDAIKKKKNENKNAMFLLSLQILTPRIGLWTDVRSSRSHRGAALS